MYTETAIDSTLDLDTTSDKATAQDGARRRKTARLARSGGNLVVHIVRLMLGLYITP